jgi:hypothetical protein
MKIIRRRNENLRMAYCKFASESLLGHYVVHFHTEIIAKSIGKVADLRINILDNVTKSMCHCSGHEI